jgi:hypothetical protein
MNGLEAKRQPMLPLSQSQNLDKVKEIARRPVFDLSRKSIFSFLLLSSEGFGSSLAKCGRTGLLLRKGWHNLHRGAK